MTTNSKKRINVLDLLVLLVVVAVVALGGYMLFADDSDKQQTVSSNMTFTLEVTRQDREILTYLKEGQTLYDSVNKSELGEIVAIYETPARALSENHGKQTIEYVELPDKVDISLEIAAKAQMEYPDISVQTVSLKIGKQLHCIAGDAAFSGTVIGLDYEDSLWTRKEETK